jgi:dynein heavy chain 2
MVHFCNNTVSAIKKNKLSNFKIDLQKTLEVYTSFDHGGDLLLLSKLKSLILDIIHNIEIVDVLISSGVSNSGEWGWYKQLKYTIDPRKDTCNVGMCDAFFDYTYEYQGNAPRLVHTPLTDKCYLTLTQGMKMGYGGNPYGPAGTGKTESVKALGQAFGRQVLVFNCDEGIDFKSMGRIFIGLVKCGAWGCFDEFNRLLEEQLSAISQQIQIIQYAIKQEEPTLELLNRTIEVNKNAGIFVTMNPAGKGYGGRSKLPDNLKQLFRPVAMSVPDNELIAEVLLFAEGFKNGKQLSEKVIALFTLSRQLLSTQQHYDWGLRALKTILTVGGQLIQKEKAQSKKLDFTREAIILIKAIRINTMSKLTFGDSKKFESLLNDMFPGIRVEDIVYEDLEKAIHETIEEFKLENNEKQLSKMLQFHEATKQRMGVVIVGPSGCGKSTIWKVLKTSYEKLGINMVTFVMNPKSMPRQQLLGEMDHDTREFKDGVLTSSARQVVKESHETKCWIICDGDIDPEWIESLNSVLDDNHLLTLPNGERISFGDNVNFIFESDNLRFASPATVSRMGMIFLSEEDVNVSRLIHTWVKKQNEDMQNKIDAWMDEIFYKALDWVIYNIKRHLLLISEKLHKY